MTDYVNLNNSRALRAYYRRNKISRPAWVVGRWLIRVLAILALIGVMLGLLVNLAISSLIIGLLMIVSAFLLAGLVLDFYLTQYWSALPTLTPLTNALASDSKVNLADYITLSAAELIANLPTKSTTLTSWSLISVLVAAEKAAAAWMMYRLALVVSQEELTNLDSTEADDSRLDSGLVIAHAAEEAMRSGRGQIEDADLIVSALNLASGGKKILTNLGLSFDDVREVSRWLISLRQQQISRPIWQESPGAGIAQDWTSGYTPFLKYFVQDLTELAGDSSSLNIIGRKTELAQIQQTLSKKRGNNLLLVGQSGVGRGTLIEGLAERIASGVTGRELAYQHVLQIDLEAVLAGVGERSEIESRLLRIFSEASLSGNTILVIPNIHLLVGGGDRVAGVDATDILIQVLQSSSIRIVATTTPDEFRRRIVPQSSLVGLFERLDITEQPLSEIVKILENAVLAYEAETKSFFTLTSLKEIASIANRYAKDQPMPASALNLLAEIASNIASSDNKYVTVDIVRRVLSDKLQIPLDVAGTDERGKLVNLENELHATVVAQDEAIKVLAGALRRARSGLASGKRPIVSLLFLGPTGVGKTETAKALARVYFGGEDRMVRFDMSEYSQPDSLVRLIGAPGAGGTKIGGLLADAIHDRPFSLLLLDEFEKAHPQTLNLFLQILDDGRLTDGTGRVIDFTNTIIIATSNAGAELIRQSVAAGEDQEMRHKKLLDFLQAQGIYKPELLNRFDGVISFEPLTQDHVRLIIRSMLGQLAAKLQTEQQLTIEFAPDLIEALTISGFDPQFGARPIRRLIQDKLETYLANAILTGKIQKGSSLMITRAEVGL